MKSLSLICTVSASLLSLPALAHHHHDINVDITTRSCPRLVRIYMPTESALIEYAGECRLGIPLARVRHEQVSLDYWVGSYLRKAKYRQTYAEVQKEICSGEIQGPTGRSYTKDFKSDVEFHVVNLPHGPASYEQLPMTEAEAKIALAEAEARCRSAEGLEAEAE